MTKDKKHEAVIEDLAVAYRQGLTTGVQLDGQELVDAIEIIMYIAKDKSKNHNLALTKTRAINFCEKYGY